MTRWQRLGPLVTDFLEDTIGYVVTRRDAALLHVALDGSGNVHRDQFIAYGVVAAFAPSWKVFHREWGELLDQHDLAYIRMSDAVSFRGPFEKKALEWGSAREQMRHGLLLDAARIISSRLTVGGAAVDLKQFSPSEKLFRYRKKMLFQVVVLKLLESQPPEYTFAFLCDDEQDTAIDNYRLLSSFKLRNQELARRIAGICFFDDVRMSQIQAADMVAYMLREERKRESDSPDSPKSDLSAVLFAGTMPTETVNSTVELREPRRPSP